MDINGVPILANIESILYEIKNQLALNKIFLLDDIKPSNRDIQFTCIAHADGHERKSSCGISTMDKYRNGKFYPAGTVHCFTCGYTASLPEFVSDCFGHNLDGGVFGYKWLMKNFVTVQVEERKPLNLNFDRGKKVSQTQPTAFITEEELDKYRNIHPYMYERKLTDEIIEWFDVGYDPETNCLTFPVCDKNGKVLFIYRRSVASKFFNTIEETVKSQTIYGIDKIYQNIDRIKEVTITESIINCLTCWVHKKPAIALLGTGSENQYKLLRELPVRVLISGLDPDEAGFRGTDKLVKRLHQDKLIYRLDYPQWMIDNKNDLNDLTWEQFENIKKIL